MGAIVGLEGGSWWVQSLFGGQEHALTLTTVMHAQLREHPKNHRVYSLNGGVWYVTYLNKVVF